MPTRLLIAFLLALALVACSSTDATPPSGGLTTNISHFNVEITSDYPATPEQRPAYNAEVRIEFNIAAINSEGNVATNYSSLLRVRPTTGIITDASAQFEGTSKKYRNLRITNGKAEGLWLTLKWGFGKGRIVVEEMKENVYDKYLRQYRNVVGIAVGVSPEIYFCAPTIKNLQRIMFETYDKGSARTALYGKPVMITEGKLVVTGYTRDGFFATDVSEPDIAWASVYVYTWRSPYVSVGSVLRYFSGQASDFYSFTEISSFPDWQVVADRPDLVPAPHLLTADDFADEDNKVEPYEAALVRVENICILPTSAWDWDSYHKYDQFPVGFDCNSKAFVAITRENVPEFSPEQCAGKRLNFMIGNLRQHAAAGYILVPRSKQDIDMDCY